MDNTQSTPSASQSSAAPQSSVLTTTTSGGSSSTQPSSTSQNTKVLWFWQSNSNPQDENEPKQWKRYSDFENDFIEDAFRREENEVKLNNYEITFGLNMQMRTGEEVQPRSVKREEVNSNEYGREERFLNPEPIDQFGHPNTFWIGWTNKNTQLSANYGLNSWKQIGELAAKGILTEGKLLNQEFDAEQMARQLRDCTNRQKLLECSVRIHSAESFLYKVFNKSLRDKDFSKIDTMGPMAWLLYWYTRENYARSKEITLYRSMNLSDGMIEEYKRHLHRRIVWNAHVSTTKDYAIAEGFGGNTIFTISVDSRSDDRYIDISLLSRHPDEREVLLDTQSKWRVKEIRDDRTHGKLHIFLQSDNLNEFNSSSWGRRGDDFPPRISVDKSRDDHGYKKGDEKGGEKGDKFPPPRSPPLKK